MRARLLIALLVAGCDLGTGFLCDTAEQCGDEGMCEANGFCSFPDPACASGRKYGANATQTLQGECVDLDATQPTGGDDVDGTSTGGPSSGVTTIPYPSTTQSAPSPQESESASASESSESSSSTSTSTGGDEESSSSGDVAVVPPSPCAYVDLEDPAWTLYGSGDTIELDPLGGQLLVELDLSQQTFNGFETIEPRTFIEATLLVRVEAWSNEPFHPSLVPAQLGVGVGEHAAVQGEVGNQEARIFTGTEQICAHFEAEGVDEQTCVARDALPVWLRIDELDDEIVFSYAYEGESFNVIRRDPTPAFVDNAKVAFQANVWMTSPVMPPLSHATASGLYTCG